jgi:neutral ceramidase
VAPALHPGTAGHLEARRVGSAIGAAAAELYGRLDGSLGSDVTLACGLRELDLDAARTTGTTGPAGAIRLSRRAAVGAALVGGAYENETPVVHRIPPFRPGTPKAPGSRSAGGPQGAKWVLGGPFQRLIVPSGTFPRILPLQVLRIGPVALVGLPFELTVDTGRRIEAAVLDRAASAGIEQVIVTSVANEYAGYCTTPEEYALQHYEGAHTLYGPQTQPFLTWHVAALAEATVRQSLVSDLVAGRRFDLRQRRYLPAPTGARAARRMLGPAQFVDATARADPYWEQEWVDVAPGDLRWHEPLVRVEMADGPDGPWRSATDDQGCDIEVVHRGPASSADRSAGHRYAVRWWDPAFRAGRRHRFVLVPNAGRPLVASDGFD